jgi:hypothetical protein
VRAPALHAPSHRTAATCGINSSERVGGRARVVAVRCHRPGSRASAAGVTWTSRTDKAVWAGRRFHTSVVDAAGAIYVIGGWNGGGISGFFQDVWASTDGGARPGLGPRGRGGGGGGDIQDGYSGVLRVVGGLLGGYSRVTRGGTQVCGFSRVTRGGTHGTKAVLRSTRGVLQGY